MTCNTSGGRGLLFQCLACLGQEPRVLDRDHRLRREILQDSAICLIGKRADLLAIEPDQPENLVVPAPAGTISIVRVPPRSTIARTSGSPPLVEFGGGEIG